MAFTFDYAKGRQVELADCPRTRDGLGTDNLAWVLLTSTGLQGDSTLNNYQTLAAILAAGNTECTATNYARKILNRGDVVLTTNTSTGVTTISLAPSFSNLVIWTSLGGPVNNVMAKMLLVYRGASADPDSAIKPLICINASGNTSGQDFKVTVPATFGSAG